MLPLLGWGCFPCWGGGASPVAVRAYFLAVRAWLQCGPGACYARTAWGAWGGVLEVLGVLGVLGMGVLGVGGGRPAASPPKRPTSNTRALSCGWCCPCPSTRRHRDRRARRDRRASVPPDGASHDQASKKRRSSAPGSRSGVPPEKPKKALREYSEEQLRDGGVRCLLLAPHNGAVVAGSPDQGNRAERFG